MGYEPKTAPPMKWRMLRGGGDEAPHQVSVLRERGVVRDARPFGIAVRAAGDGRARKVKHDTVERRGLESFQGPRVDAVSNAAVPARLDALD